MATVSDGQNPGRSATPQRQSPSPARSGHGEAGLDPTEQLGQTPSEIFGFSQSYHTGAPGSAGGGGSNSDVTTQDGQFDGTLTHVTEEEITSTGLHGSQGATHASGGESVRFTDPFGYMGNEHRESHASMAVNGPGDSTTWGDDNGFAGPTLPVLEGNRPTETGIGQGHVRHSPHPNNGA